MAIMPNLNFYLIGANHPQELPEGVKTSVTLNALYCVMTSVTFIRNIDYDVLHGFNLRENIQWKKT